MALPEGFDCKYLVLKWSDIEIALSNIDKNMLDLLLEKIELYREDQKKPKTNDYIVVNTDEPYIKDITDILKKNGHWG